MTIEKSTTYIIDNDTFGIKNDGTSPDATTEGIRSAITWAKANGYNHVYLTGGTYSVKVDLSEPAVVFDMPSDIHFELASNCTLVLVGNSNPSYRIFNVFYKSNVKISGGKIVGDKNSHYYDISVGFVRGGVNADGSLNDDPNYIRSEVIDRKLNRGLLAFFRLWKMDKVTATGFNFYQYKDEATSTGYRLVRTNGLFAPASSGGRGWGGTVEEYNKMVFTINIANNPLTDEEIAGLSAKVDNQYYTHESGFGVGIFASWNVEVKDMEISHCNGDGILTGLGNHYEDGSLYTYNDIGGGIRIENCHIHHNRRQGISLCGPNDVDVINCNIHHTGYADDDVTINFQSGTAPMFGIDIESMVVEKVGFPYEHLHYEKEGFQTNYRINIKGNYVHHNARGHFVNCDGTYVTIEDNKFEGWTTGHVSSYPNYWYVKYLNNIFISCDLLVAGNNYVDGVIMSKGSIRGSNARDAFISNVKIKDGAFLFASTYGYFGSPTVNVATSTFTFSKATEMGSGAKLTFENWLGKVPTGIDVSKLYYSVNATTYGFQVSETKGGTPVVITDAGQAGFNISRAGYGSTVIDNVSVDRDYRTSTAVETGFSILLVGGTVRNITVKNYDIDIKPPDKYVGKPISVDGLVLIEGTANFQGCNLANAEFMKGKARRMGGDITFGSTNVNQSRKIKGKNLNFENVDVNFEGDIVLTNCIFVNVATGKANGTPYKSTILNSYFENSKLGHHWLTTPNLIVYAGNTLRNTTKDFGAGVVFASNNIEI